MNKRFFIFIILIVLIILSGKLFSPSQEDIEEKIKSIPLFPASLLFVFLYIIGTFFIWYLKDPLKLIGAIAFGAYLSTFLIYISEIVNAFIFFKLSNFLGKDFLEKFLSGKFKNFYNKLQGIPLGWIFLLRAVPLIPYRVLDVSFGLSKVPLKRYLIAVVLASPLRIFWIQFILASVRSLSLDKMILYFQENSFIFLWSLIYLILAAILAFKIKR